MYDWPERRAEVDAEWADVRDRLRGQGFDAPERLARRNADLPPVSGGIRDAEGRVIAPDPATLPPDEFDLATLWRHPALLFSQTCWGPLQTTGLAAHVRAIGQSDYSAFEGGEGELYRSAIVARASPSPLWGEPQPGDGERGGAGTAPPPGPSLLPPHTGEAGAFLATLRGLRFALNDRHSLSGFLSVERDLAAAGLSSENMGLDAFFAETIQTGSHRASIRAVAEGRADLAAIDCRSWFYAQRYETAAQALVVVGWTAPRRGLPFITSRNFALASL